jgi:hypothetical protein
LSPINGAVSLIDLLVPIFRTVYLIAKTVPALLSVRSASAELENAGGIRKRRAKSDCTQTQPQSSEINAKASQTTNYMPSEYIIGCSGELISKSCEHNRISVGVDVGGKVAQSLICVRLSSAAHLAARRFSSASHLVEAEGDQCRDRYSRLDVL